MFQNEREAHEHFLAQKAEEDSKIKLAVEVTQAQQIEIEEKCMSEGLTISQYFIYLHQKGSHPTVNTIIHEKALPCLEKHCPTESEKPEELTGVPEAEAPKRRGRPPKNAS